ncbi:MAG: hypothetical protein RL518_2585 [Pseudomonadota bacterium]|jgi:hypothetical protein
MSITPPKPSGTLSDTYDAAFFEQHRQYRDTYEHLARLIREIAPSNAVAVLDVGCGHCLLLDALQRHFSSAAGIDGSSAGVPSHLRDKVALRDLTVTDWREASPPPCDVVVTLETAEHLAPDCAPHFVAQLLRGTPSMVFFSAATPYQDCGQNPTHIHEQPLSYWVELFEGSGYSLAVDETIRMRTSMITSGLYGSVGWYPKNILVFVPGVATITNLTPPPHILSSNPVFQLIFDRDRLEFENIILKRALKNAANPRRQS